jgi:hypothetical protein
MSEGSDLKAASVQIVFLASMSRVICSAVSARIRVEWTRCRIGADVSEKVRVDLDTSQAAIMIVMMRNFAPVIHAALVFGRLGTAQTVPVVTPEALIRKSIEAVNKNWQQERITCTT